MSFALLFQAFVWCAHIFVQALVPVRLSEETTGPPWPSSSTVPSRSLLLRSGLSLNLELANYGCPVSSRRLPVSSICCWEYRCAPRFYVCVGDPNPCSFVVSILRTDGWETTSGNRILWGICFSFIFLVHVKPVWCEKNHKSRFFFCFVHKNYRSHKGKCGIVISQSPPYLISETL